MACVACSSATSTGAQLGPTSSTSGSATQEPSGSQAACSTTDAVDLSGDDPFRFSVQSFTFTPDCFIARLSASVAIENKDGTKHTWTIDGSAIDAPLIADKTYHHGPATGLLEPGVYEFHCSIHPDMTGTVIFVR
jgi:plastocyanin